MNIVFMGSPEFAVPALSAVVESGHTIQAVVTGYDKKRGRGGKLTPTAVKRKAMELGLPILHADRLKGNDSLKHDLVQLAPDLIVVVAYKILPTDWLSIPRYGAINIHASLLPKYRGAAPIHHAVIQGEKETGVTFFVLDQGIDTGKILLQKKITIGENETTGDVYERLCRLGAQSLPNVLSLIEEGNVEPKVQQSEKATTAPKLFKEDARINFHEPMEKVHNFIRGMNPFPGAWCYLDNQVCKITQARKTKSSYFDAGKAGIHDDSFLVGTTTTDIQICSLRLEGKKEVDGASFLLGYRGRFTIS